MMNKNLHFRQCDCFIEFFAFFLLNKKIKNNPFSQARSHMQSNLFFGVHFFIRCYMYFTFVFIAPVFLFLTTLHICNNKNLVTIYVLHSTLHLSYTKTCICYRVILTTVDTSLTSTPTPTPTNTRGNNSKCINFTT